MSNSRSSSPRHPARILWLPAILKLVLVTSIGVGADEPKIGVRIYKSSSPDTIRSISVELSNATNRSLYFYLPPADPPAYLVPYTPGQVLNLKARLADSGRIPVVSSFFMRLDTKQTHSFSVNVERAISRSKLESGDHSFVVVFDPDRVAGFVERYLPEQFAAYWPTRMVSDPFTLTLRNRRVVAIRADKRKP